MIEAFASGACRRSFTALARFDQASAVENAGIGQLRQAREVTAGLAGFGAMLIMHALLMPDTPALAALRARVTELGAGSMLINLARQVMQPQGIASAVASCLDPMYSALYQSLSELVARRVRHCCTWPGTKSTIPSTSWRPGSLPSVS